MDPVIKINSEESNTLKFTMSNINHSLANSLRRIVLSDVPTLVFRTFPHNESKVDIVTNTTRLNNEIIKQRIGCIPIHITDVDFPYEEYVVEVDKKNDTDTIQVLTTADFKMKNISTDKYLSATAVKEIFPPDSITGDYIPITRLRPKLSDNVEGESIQFNAYLDIGTAKQDGMYNIVSTCAYGATMDTVKATDIWNDKKKDLVKSGMSEEDIDYERKNWFLLEAKRNIIPDSFDFTVESVGVFSNFSIIHKACDIMLQKCKKFISMLEKGDIPIEVTENTTISNEYTITLKNEDYTLGNALVYFLYEKYYSGNKTLSFVGFRVPHPHIPEGVIRMAFESVNDATTVSQYLTFAAEDIIKTFTNIQSKFKDTYLHRQI
jgi:DNA-directed RNA polymerase II subunit RPB3